MLGRATARSTRGEPRPGLHILEGHAFPPQRREKPESMWEALAVVPARAGGGLGQVKNNKEVSQQDLEVS